MKVLVTNCTRNAGLAAMRSLARAGWAVHGADDRRPRARLRSRYASAPYAALPHQDAPGFGRALLDLVAASRPDVLIAIRGAETAVRLRAPLLALTHALIPAREAFDVMNDKRRLLALCDALGVDAPRVYEPRDALRALRGGEVERLVVKPCIDVGGGDGVHIVARESALLAALDDVRERFGDALVTEYVPGNTGQLRAVHLLFDRDTRLVAGFVLKKLRIWPAEVGVTVAAESVHEWALVERLLPLFEALNWQGAADAELKVDSRDGRAKLLEINPRFSGALQFPIGCGVDLPHLYCRASLGERLPACNRPHYPEGVRYVDTVRWFAAARHAWCRAEEPPAALARRLLAEWRAPRVRSVHELSDPAAWLAKLAIRDARSPRLGAADWRPTRA